MRLQEQSFLFCAFCAPFPNGLSFFAPFPIYYTTHRGRSSFDLGLEERPIVKIYGPLKLARHQLLCSTAWPSCLLQIVNYPNGLHMFHKCWPRTFVHCIKCELTTQDTITLSSMHNCCAKNLHQRSLKAFNMFAERKHSS